jgi:hypothetical protein
MHKIDCLYAANLLRHFFGRGQIYALPSPNGMAMCLEPPAVQADVSFATSAPPAPPASKTPSQAPPLTPLSWLAKQAPEDTIFIYIDPASHQLLELRSQPRQQLAKLFNIPMYRDPAAQWQSAGANCLMRVALEPAIERAKFEQAVGELLFLQSARFHLSTKLASLDEVIAYLHAELTQNSKAPGQAAASLLGLPAKVWITALCDVNERVPVADAWQLLGFFLRQRQAVSVEMADVDKDLLPALESLGDQHG